MANGVDEGDHPNRKVGRDRLNYMQHLMDFDEGNITDENIHDIADAIHATGLHYSAGRYGRFLNWYENEYLNNQDY